MTGGLAAVATLTLLVWPPYPCSDCGIQTGAGGGGTGALLLEAVSF